MAWREVHPDPHVDSLAGRTAVRGAAVCVRPCSIDVRLDAKDGSLSHHPSGWLGAAAESWEAPAHSHSAPRLRRSPGKPGATPAATCRLSLTGSLTSQRDAARNRMPFGGFSLGVDRIDLPRVHRRSDPREPRAGRPDRHKARRTQCAPPRVFPRVPSRYLM